ncbi:TonB-dependent receptor [Sphingomonas sp. DG1-23]|uniref:TonB-dependent receptor plug domain-containing protein n=1 Tax=Sphingomonas sp. DG1-23 TaxID=3068316 RepID=UPI00273D526E|nr:TonB-dependent receptor [Sphingomonas sp. DG1-23]MDP5281113.1 TonB-dependent receptor [Sphingomonas sp. DG1-23]
MFTRISPFLAGISLIAFATSAAAQTVDPVPAAEETSGEDIVVTGSRVAERSVADSPVPVDVIGGEALTRSGATETNRVLRDLVPSFNFPQPSLVDGTDSQRPATLRGLAPDQVLVLVNGKRRHQSALLNLNGSVGRGSSAVDLNEIPAIAIDRVEILRDGASSLYGSDAIAGVINLQLRRSEGVRASVTYGKYLTSMDGVSDVTGVANSGGIPTVLTPGGGANDILQLNTGGDRDRHDGDTLTLATNFGLPVGAGGYLNLTAQFRDRDPTNRSGADPRRQYLSVGDPRELSIDRFTHRYGDGEAIDYNLFANAGYELGGGFELYAFGSYGIRDASGGGFYRRANDVRNRDWSASTTSFVPIYADGYLPYIATQVEDVSGAVGIRGDIGGFTGDLSVVYGSNQLDYKVTNSVNVSLGAANSPRSFNAGGLRAGQTVVNLDLSRKFDFAGLQSFGIAFGGEYRNENYKIVAGDVASYINGPFSAAPFNAAGGSQVFPGFRPNNATDVSRSSWAGYAEADADVTDFFSVQLAGRYEHYSDFGDTWNGKIAARLEPVEGIAIRGSASTGFRAPSLAQQYFTATSTVFTGGNLIETGTFAVSDPVSRALGAKDLEAEKSTNLGAGVVFSLVPGLTVTADYYNIKIRDRVVLSESLSGAAVVALLTGAGITNATSARFFVNGVDTRTQGVDVVATYKVPEFGAGRFTLSAGYNHNQTKITDRASLPSLPGLIVFGRSESLRLTDGQPRDKINASVDWDLDPVGLTVRTNRYGRVLSTGSSTDLAIPAGQGVADYWLEPKWITDVELRFEALPGVSLAVGADNVFDVYPTKAPAGGVYGNNNYFLPYSSFSPFGFNGRFVYSRIAFDF